MASVSQCFHDGWNPFWSSTQNVGDQFEPLFIPRGNNSLDLADVNTVGSSEPSETFFAVVEKIYSFFSASTHRWEVLQKHMPTVEKTMIVIHGGVQITQLWKHFIKVFIMKWLHKARLVTKMKTMIREVKLVACWMRFNVILFRNEVLKEAAHCVQKYLQRKDLPLENCVRKMKTFVILPMIAMRYS